MNRHQSNPFLSEWDDEDLAAAAVLPTNTHLFDTLSSSVEDNQQQQSAAPPRRSSCSQAELGTAPGAGRGTRPSLYRRNMSSFEAASLQLEQHQQQMLENGSNGGPIEAQKDLIARMTADFQSAIQTNDKQFESLALNPFDPFETIVDDDGLNSPAPSSLTDANKTRFDLGANMDETLDSGDAAKIAIETRKTTHDSIDDDDYELVSTPVRNIKSHGDLGGQATESGAVSEQAMLSTATSAAASNEAPDSIKKASMFATLLASAESGNQQQQQQIESSGGSVTNRVTDFEAPACDESQDVEATTHVIKGSPNSMGDGADRSVSFFDPFETVIDKDALTSLVSDANQTSPSPSPSKSTTTDRPNDLESSAGAHLQHQQVAESTSIETVIENQESAGESNAQTEVDSQGDTQQRQRHDDANMDRNTLKTTETTTASSASDLQYDSSAALDRPQGRRLAPSSGIAPPQPTPAKKAPASGRNQRKKASSFQEDSSDSSEADDRIQIVIKAREIDAAGQQDNTSKPAALVPLLPPPPSKSSMRQARERGQVEDMPSPIMGYKSRQQRQMDDSDDEIENKSRKAPETVGTQSKPAESNNDDEPDTEEGADEHADDDDDDDEGGQFVIKMSHSDDERDGKCETPLYDDDTSYVLEDFPPKYDGPGWEMMLRYPPKKKLTSNRFWKKIFVKLAQVPLVPSDRSSKPTGAHQSESASKSPEQAAAAATCWALQIFDHQEDKKPMQEIPIQATYTVSEISSQLFDQFGKIFTIKLQYIFYKERVGVRQGQLARFIHTGHIGSSTTSGGHGVDPISIGAIKRMGAPIEHSPQISQIIKLGCCNYDHIRQFKESLEDCLFRMPIHRDRALTSYKTEEVQMAVRDETYIELNQIGTITRQLARVRLFFLSFLNGTPVVEVGINDFHRQGREVVGRMDILPVVTEEWIRLEAWELHSTVDEAEFENPELRLIKLTPPDATFFELMRFRVRPPRNRELPLQISANMSITRTRVSINCEVMVPGCVSRKHGQIPCENIAIRVQIPECWVYFFREEKHFRMGSKKSVNRRPGKVKGIERFLGGGGLQNDLADESSLIEVTSGQAKYEHHHHAIVWRAARWPKESQSAYVQNTMKIRLPLTAYDKIPEQFYEFVHVEYTMPATTVSHTTLRSISVNPYDEEPPEKYVKYAAKYEYKVKMRLAVNLGARSEAAPNGAEVSPIVILKQPDRQDDLQREEDSDDDDEDDDDDEGQGENRRAADH